MIDAFNDKLLTFSEAAIKCQIIRGRKHSTASLWRWATKGSRGVKLECVRIGRDMLTTEAALNAYFNAAGSAPVVQRKRESKPPRDATAIQREREIASAKRRLIARGVLPKETEH